MTDFFVLNPRMRVLLSMVKESLAKASFVPAGDPAAGGGMPMGADPMAAGGAVPPGMDPAAAAGAPPMAPPPPEGGGGGMDPMAAMAATGAGDGGLQQMVQQAVQQAMAGAGGAGGAPGQIKPKIDIPTELMQIKQMLAKLVDASGLQLSAESMVATPEKLTESLAQAPTKAAQEQSPLWAKAAGLLAVLRAQKNND